MLTELRWFFVYLHSKGLATVCDWLYQDISCREPGSCVLASPGYPGLYPPNRQCRYLITTSSIHTQVNIIFNTLLLPHNHCGTDYVAVYQGSTPASPLLTTLCANKKATLSYSGPNILLEFSILMRDALLTHKQTTSSHLCVTPWHSERGPNQYNI
ncbi:hypothetical protein PR048_017528 [Dryococelus australis]|uniref:CUB domain-containing protein n=1 Tax=Dryococelus australis TaxID=614101 RepID=A0ABQ9H9R5_9NEOP|nr:hypothetical protein PR048_017528 [Dryococelus australis]